MLEAKIPYEAFKKIALSQSVGIQVGNDAVELHEKNRAAPKDLNNRMVVTATNASATN